MYRLTNSPPLSVFMLHHIQLHRAKYRTWTEYILNCDPVYHHPASQSPSQASTRNTLMLLTGASGTAET